MKLENQKHQTIHANVCNIILDVMCHTCSGSCTTVAVTFMWASQGGCWRAESGFDQSHRNRTQLKRDTLLKENGIFGMRRWSAAATQPAPATLFPIKPTGPKGSQRLKIKSLSNAIFFNTSKQQRHHSCPAARVSPNLFFRTTQSNKRNKSHGNISVLFLSPSCSVSVVSTFTDVLKAAHPSAECSDGLFPRMY